MQLSTRPRLLSPARSTAVGGHVSARWRDEEYSVSQCGQVLRASMRQSCLKLVVEARSAVDTLCVLTMKVLYQLGYVGNGHA